MKTLVVDLVGPDFFKEAQTLARNLKLHTVGELRVQLGHTSPESPNVKAAVKSLQHYLLPNAAVTFITTPSKLQTQTFDVPQVPQDLSANRAKTPTKTTYDDYIRG